MDEGLVKTLLPPNERDTEKSRTRATGVVLRKNLDVTFLGRTDTKLYQFRLEGGMPTLDQGQEPSRPVRLFRPRRKGIAGG